MTQLQRLCYTYSPLKQRNHTPGQDLVIPQSQVSVLNGVDCPRFIVLRLHAIDQVQAKHLDDQAGVVVIERVHQLQKKEKVPFGKDIQYIQCKLYTIYRCLNIASATQMVMFHMIKIYSISYIQYLVKIKIDKTLNMKRCYKNQGINLWHITCTSVSTTMYAIQCQKM